MDLIHIRTRHTHMVILIFLLKCPHPRYLHPPLQLHPKQVLVDLRSRVSFFQLLLLLLSFLSLLITCLFVNLELASFSHSASSSAHASSSSTHLDGDESDSSSDQHPLLHSSSSASSSSPHGHTQHTLQVVVSSSNPQSAIRANTPTATNGNPPFLDPAVLGLCLHTAVVCF